MSRRDNSRDVTGDHRDSPALGGPVHHGSKPNPARKFDGWLAGASAEQQARWERMQAGAKVDDETLPAALRGGALEVF